MMEATIEDYYIKTLIREEILGNIYLGVHQPTNTKVTIRLINPSLADAVFYYNLSNKNNALVGLNHPSIGKFYKYIKQAEQLYLISEYVPNATSLLQYVAGGEQPMEEEKIWYIFKQIVDAFDYAHSKAVSHFTVHPETIRVVTADQVKILDFGVASLFVNHLNKGLPENFEMYNSPYRSPEHVLNRDLTIRSDVYSVGVLLFECITRHTLYPLSLSLSEINTKILHEPLPSINLYTQAFAHSPLMQAIIDKATAKDPSDRFQDFRELKESLLAKKIKWKKNRVNNIRQEVTADRLISSSKKTSSGDKLARLKNPRKAIGQAILATVLMVGIIAINVYFNHSFFTQSAISLREKLYEKVSSFLPSERNINVEPDDANEADTSIILKQNSKPAKEKLIGIITSATSLKDSGIETSKTSISKTGSTKAIHSVEKFSQAQLQNRLEAFYQALGSKDIQQVREYYASTLTKFFNESNVTNKQLQSLLLKAWKRTPQDKHEILWDTFNYDYDQEGKYTIEFYMNYVYRRANTTTWRSQKLYTIIKMDNNLKIYYMSGD
jgi:serine/threonine protein kinase